MEGSLGAGVRLRVDVGDPFEHPKVVKVPRDVMESLGLRDRDSVEVRAGEHATVAIVKSSRWLRGVIQMSYSMRLTLNVRRGEEVSFSFRKVRLEPARKAVLRLETRGRVYEFIPTPVMFVFGPFPVAGITLTPRERGFEDYVEAMMHYLKQMMLNAPYVKGDYIVLTPGLFTWSESDIVMRVAETEPDAPIYVDRDTIIEMVR